MRAPAALSIAVLIIVANATTRSSFLADAHQVVRTERTMIMNVPPIRKKFVPMRSVKKMDANKTREVIATNVGVSPPHQNKVVRKRTMMQSKKDLLLVDRPTECSSQ